MKRKKKLTEADVRALTALRRSAFVQTPGGPAMPAGGADAGADLGPAMREIAGHLAAPDGTPWAPLTEGTKRQRRRKGYRDGPILERSGDLISSIVSDSDATTAIAGTNLEYAPRHQLGFEGPDALGRPIDTPARPFLGLWPEHEDLIIESIHRHLARALRG